MYKNLIASLILISLASISMAKTVADDTAIFSEMDIFHPTIDKNAMVASQEAVASDVGASILKQGGNAVDAAVAVGFSLAVTLPRAGNIGGGGFMLIYDAKTQKSIALDYREIAPIKASKDMYLDDKGNAINIKSKFHGMASGVPGTVDGMLTALEQYGTMPLDKVMAPAIKLAEDGIVMTPSLYNSLLHLKSRLTKWDSTKSVFYKPDGSLYQVGEIFKQPDLAKSLKLIAKNGRDGFYKGETAKKIVAAVTKAGGIISMQDMSEYKSVLRKPVTGSYRGYKIVSMPLPSSGGIHIIEILNILENYPIQKMGHNTAKTIHAMAESMKYAYADRSEYLGDSDFVKVPVKQLTSKEYAKKLFDQIDPNKAKPSTQVKPGLEVGYESNETTHYSIVDQAGNMVANTYTLNFSYGSGLVADGTGILMNNEMDDFSVKPGVANAYGLIGGKANAIEPKKRPLSSMSPTFILKDNKPFLVTGSPGGSRIITTVLQVISNVIDHQMNISEATNAVRIHHQWLPDVLRIEKGLSLDTINLLKKQGYDVQTQSTMGSTQSILIRDNLLHGASDPRRPDAKVSGF